MLTHLRGASKDGPVQVLERQRLWRQIALVLAPVLCWGNTSRLWAQSRCPTDVAVGQLLVDSVLNQVKAEPKKAPPKKALDAGPATLGDESEGLPPPLVYEPYELLRMQPFDRLVFRRTKRMVDIVALEQRPLPKPWPKQLVVELYGGDGTRYMVDLTQVEEIIYFEDLVLQAGDAFVEKREFEKAWDFYYHILRYAPKWPGLAQRLQDFLFKEADYLLIQGQYLRALNNLRELARRNAAYPLLESRFSRTVDYLMRQAEDQRDYRKVRTYLQQLKESYPSHEVVQLWMDRLTQRASGFLREGLRAEQQGRLREAAWLVLEAADVWPQQEGLEEAYRRSLGKFPVLFVGVRSVATQFNPWASPGTADARVARLLHTNLLEVAEVGEQTRFEATVATLQVGELGRHLLFRLRPGLRWSNGRPITALDIAGSIAARVDPDLPSYDAALASAFAGLEVPTLQEVSVTLKRTVLRPEVFFLFPLLPGRYLEFAIRPSQRSSQQLPVGSGAYFADQHEVGRQTRMLANPNYHVAGKPFIKEIVEREYAKNREAVDDLLLGKLTFVENLHPVQALRLQGVPEIALRKRQLPALHVLAFDFRRPELRSRELRRAVAYAINREAILRRALLNGHRFDDAVVASGPVPRNSYAYLETLQPWPFKPALAKALVAVVRRSFGGTLPVFQLQYPNTDEAREAVRFIQQYLKLAGIETAPVQRPLSELEQDIRLGRRFDLAYRILYVRDPVFDLATVLSPGPTITPAGQILPNCSSDWLRYLLSRLDLVTNWGEAVQLLRNIQQEARDDVAVLPLWEITEYDAYRTNLKGVPDRALWTYEGVADWQLQPAYPKEQPGLTERPLAALEASP
jgi:peptide/nickel transport system substrate-binding protein